MYKNILYKKSTFTAMACVATLACSTVMTSPIQAHALTARVIVGDVNCDGLVDACDASLVLSHYALISTGQSGHDLDIDVADVNRDGLIDAVDASQILAYYAALSTGQTPHWPFEEDDTPVSGTTTTSIKPIVTTSTATSDESLVTTTTTTFGKYPTTTSTTISGRTIDKLYIKSGYTWPLKQGRSSDSRIVMTLSEYDDIDVLTCDESLFYVCVNEAAWGYITASEEELERYFNIVYAYPSTTTSAETTSTTATEGSTTTSAETTSTTATEGSTTTSVETTSTTATEGSTTTSVETTSTTATDGSTTTSAETTSTTATDGSTTTSAETTSTTATNVTTTESVPVTTTSTIPKGDFCGKLIVKPFFSFTLSEEPDFDADIIAELGGNTVIYIESIETDGVWYKVTISDELKGYLYIGSKDDLEYCFEYEEF